MSERITVTDARRAGMCALGQRSFSAHYGLNFRDFLKNGIDAETLLATGDANAQLVVAKKRGSADG